MKLHVLSCSIALLISASMGVGAERGFSNAALSAPDNDGDGVVTESEFLAYVKNGLLALETGRPESATATPSDPVATLLAELPVERFERVVTTVLARRYADSIASFRYADRSPDDQMLIDYATRGAGVGGKALFDDPAIERLVLALLQKPLFMSDLDRDGRVSLADSLVGPTRAEVLLNGDDASPNPEDRLSDWSSNVPEASEKFTKVIEKLEKAGGKRDLSSIRKALTAVGLIKKKVEGKIPTWVLRESADIDLSSLQAGGDVASAKSATISFSQDNNDNHREVWDLKAAVVWPSELQNLDFRALNQPSAIFGLPSVEWQKVKGTEKKDTDVLTFRLGVGAIWTHDAIAEGTSSTEILFSGAFLHDSEKSSNLYSAELGWSPIVGGTPIGSFKPLGGSPWDVRLDVRLKTQYFSVLDAGRDEDLSEGMDVWRLGGTFDIRLRPKGDEWNKILFGFSYAYYAALEGTPDESDLLKASIAYTVSKNYSLNLAYENGSINLLVPDVDKFTLKIGIKY